ncbi:CopG family transcriptional regulator [Clostridium thermobutyricum]|uniref:CopG family transcriptional regulator n=1 Tax=Clostridium thermobutyricum TaxID=29372 RepID=UPI0018ABA49E|nr:CopG family transcriptional regulator [Clostridium thermobutyricum]
MATKEVKTEVIRVRVSLEQKNKFKKLAEKKGITVSEIICGYIEKEIELQEFRNKYSEKIEKRIVATDKKLFKLKEKLK